jgi:predicted nuclease of restriction endonuclease-like (RecB) superfamily
MAKKRIPPKSSPPKTVPIRLRAGKSPAVHPRLDVLYRQIHEILTAARNRAWKAVNTVMLDAYWEVGRVIVEDEQAGEKRAGYGQFTLEGLSLRLQADFGKGYDPSNLRNMRAFFLIYPIRDALRHELSWTHYRSLLRIDNPDARTFYEAEAVSARWGTRELDRQINSLLFERLALSRDKAGVMALARKGHEITQPSDLVKDPMVLEFTGLRQDERFRESDLEQALIDQLQKFLLELGKGFAFMGRQQRITLDGQHFFIDLVFYNRLTRSFVLVDLKVGKLTHQDLGQIQMYVNYYQRELTAPDENPPIGIVLCTDKSEAVVRYALPEGNTQIFASRYKLHLPTEEELAAELQRERWQIESLKQTNPELTGDTEHPQPASSKVMKVNLWLRVENNNKHIRGKKKAREEIEDQVLSRYQMKKERPEGCDYQLTIPYETDKDLDATIYDEIIGEANSIADIRHCFIEADIVAVDDPDRSW